MATIIVTTPVGLPPTDASHSTAKWYATTAPARFIAIDDFVRHVRLDRNGYNGANNGGPTDDDLYRYIDAAVDYAENLLGASLAPRQIVATFYDCEEITLPRGPVIDVLSVKDKSGTAITDYTLRTIGRLCRVELAQSPIRPLTVTYNAGYTNVAVNGDATTPAIPASIVSAVLMHAATLFGQRESISDKPMMAVPHSLDAFYAARRRTTGIG